MQADYRISGENLLICCSNEGEVRGYKFSTEDANIAAANVYKDCQEAIRDLSQKKQVKIIRFINRLDILIYIYITQALLLELQNLEEATKQSQEPDIKSTTRNTAGEIPVNIINDII